MRTSKKEKIRKLVNMYEAEKEKGTEGSEFFKSMEDVATNNGSFESLRDGKGIEKFVREMVEDMAEKKGGYLMNQVFQHEPVSVGLGSKSRLFGMKAAMMMAARVLHNPYGREFMIQKMEELVDIPDEFLGLIEGGKFLVAAKYVIRGAMGSFVSNHMVGAGHDGSGYRATEGEINDFQNNFEFDADITKDIVGIALGMGSSVF